MQLTRRILHVMTIVLNGFLALTAFGGGFSIVVGIIRMPVELLHGSPFRDFTVPGLSLFVLVGGSALIAMILLIRRSSFALLASVCAGVIIMFFEFIEVMVIGSPPGPAQFLQMFYFALGFVIVAVSLIAWMLDLIAVTA